ncbi:MAG: phosphoenolpyruvate synthase [bacterium]
MFGNKFIIWFRKASLKDTALVGGKNAALGEMISNLRKLGINVPNGFAVTAKAYNYFLQEAGIKEDIEDRLRGLDTTNVRDLMKAGTAVRKMILQADFPPKLEKEIIKSYKKMAREYSDSPDVAVRSSATAEDLPGASFAGQQETYLNIRGNEHLLVAVRKCFASLFTNRALSYRADKGFSLVKGISLSVAVQKMVRADLSSSGVAFTTDTETGFNKIIMINSSYGLGESIVQGAVIPDEFIVFKPMLHTEFDPIISRSLGKKSVKVVYSSNGTKTVKNKINQQNKYSLSDKEVVKLAEWCLKIEEHFSKKYGGYQPMDIEWAKDGRTKQLYILQARPETVHSIKAKNEYEEYELKEKGDVILTGAAIGSKIATGKIRVIKDTKQIHQFKKGEILVTGITDPDWEPIMKIASAIITDKGGRTSHAAIVSRELGIPAIVGTKKGTNILKNSQEVTVDCSSGTEGFIYQGKLSFKINRRKIGKIPSVKTKVMVNVGTPREAFRSSRLPVKGVGLGRLEFIITSYIQIHPNALINFNKLKKSKKSAERKIARIIEKKTIGYSDKKKFYIDKLAEGIAKISAAFYPNEVIIRFSDFKTNEYRALIGGEFYEPEESNPMIGWRGASRYLDPNFKEAFRLECLAVKKVRNQMGLTNVVVMVPFCRTAEEGENVVKLIKKNGLDRDKDKSLNIYVMCEIPSDIISADEFLEIFDGMSIGSNDLTQLVLGLDRDSALISHVGNENDPAVREMVKEAIEACHRHKKYIGICGQAPSDYPDFAEFLVKERIDSISLNPDAVIPTLPVIAAAEKKRRRLSS